MMKKTFCFSLPDDIAPILKVYAEAVDRSVSGLVLHALREYMKHHPLPETAQPRSNDNEV